MLKLICNIASINVCYELMPISKSWAIYFLVLWIYILCLIVNILKIHELIIALQTQISMCAITHS